VEEEGASPAYVQNERVSVRTMEDEDERNDYFQNEWESESTMEEEDDRPAHIQKEWELVRTMEEEYERKAHSQNKGDSLRTVEEEDERIIHFQNEGNSVRHLKLRADEGRLNFEQIEDITPVVMEEDEQDAQYLDAEGSVKIKIESLPFMLAEDTLGNEASMEFPVKTGRQRKDCIVTSKVTGKKKNIQMNKMGVGLTPPQISRQLEPRSCLRTARATGVVGVM
jgi:hypothetical protein